MAACDRPHRVYAVFRCAQYCGNTLNENIKVAKNCGQMKNKIKSGFEIYTYKLFIFVGVVRSFF